MTEELLVSLSDPRARVVDTDDGRWFVSAFDPGALERLVRDAESVAEVQGRVGDVAENAVLVHVSTDGDHAERAYGYRSPTATRELYYLEDSEGTAVLADHFRTALSRLSVEDRIVSPRAAADHLLFRAPIAPGSFVSGIRLLGQGEWLRWDGETDERETALSDRIRAAESIRPSRAVDAIDGALAGLLSSPGDDERLVNLFSGGVDSTLTHTYLDDATALSVGIDSPEYAYEIEYAEEAAELLGAHHRQLLLDEGDVLAHAETGIEALGSPSYAFPTVLVEQGLRRGEAGTYLMAVGADALFGMGGTKSARIASWLEPALSLPGVGVAAARAPERIRSPLRALLTVSDQLGRDPADPESYPQRVAAYTEPSLVGEFLGEDLVAQRCRRLVNYVRNRVVDAGAAGGGFAGPIEYANLASLYGHRIGSRYRQLAHAHGKPLLTPFDTETATRCSLSIPVERRYIRGLRGIRDLEPKYLLKELLERRLPAYDAGKEKGAGILPFRRYRAEGALRNAFEKYEAPEFVPDRMRKRALEGSGRQSWNLLTYAIWRDRVLADPDLEPVPAAAEATYGF
ncbi:asparagine synthase-related protein [Halegenticoccus soli]|uniref:asparagine synthase-related protein n=1 Tax=Halegenticoccus soli TaxID=1985678 RepID=UPI000C6DF278|nr:asparagine synthase-related protein [Halegenticoccus soli]